MKPYKIPNEYFFIEDEIKKSRFITHIERCSTPEEAKYFINKIKSENPQANHNCWAYISGTAGDLSTAGMSDDGEPQGTAGKPMLNVLAHSDMGETAVVVTRYFGGVKLGTGGLVRAYSAMTRLGLENVPTILVQEKDFMRFTISYSIHEIIKNVLPTEGVWILNEIFTADVAVELECLTGHTENIKKSITDISAGKAVIEIKKAGSF